MSFAFRNQITLADKSLQSDKTSVPLTDNVTLTAPAGFTNADRLTLEGQGYPCADKAYEEGKRWRHRLSVAFAHAGIAADFDAPPFPERRQNDRPESPEAPGLHVFPQAGLMVHIGITMNAFVGQCLDTFLSHLSQDLDPALGSVPQGLDQRLELAYATFHRALATRNAELKFVFLVTAVEALIEEGEKPQPIRDALRVLQKHVRDQSADFAPDVKERLIQILENAEQESISQRGAQLASQLSGTYGDKTPEGFFKHVYGRRSQIVHGSTEYTGKNKRPSARQIAGDIPELQRFVLDLLHAARST
ncbi:hypothetical protein MSM1_02260 [Mycobacterium sp. SM1]|uniref:HEPN domain-containing protein n=1 Tax=Mycobacterium sp. SM1 TaxID=2816243 RepID=UPI001BD15E82|nr:HEPN domain-containing protein [Mycobacterium sp. SM1]MBS4727232.1 hypothetical protein [Mycobacterium sp. SM1]